MHVFTRDDSTGAWTKTVVGSDPNDPSVRSLIVHRDAQTGVDYIFAGAGGNVVRGYYNASAPGRITWEATPEFQSPLQKRIMAMAEANGSLHVLTKPYWYRRTDGNPANWTQVFSYHYPAPSTSSGMRGLTAIPNPVGTGQVLLAGLESNAGYIVLVDPQASYQEIWEIDFPTYISAALGTGCNVVVPSYNQFTPVTQSDTAEAVHLIGMQATNPNDGPRLITSSGTQMALMTSGVCQLSRRWLRAGRQTPRGWWRFVRFWSRRSRKIGAASSSLAGMMPTMWTSTIPPGSIVAFYPDWWTSK